MEQKQSKYDAKPVIDDRYCSTCYYYCEGFCIKEQKYEAVSTPNNEYCSDYHESILLGHAAENKRSV